MKTKSSKEKKVKMIDYGWYNGREFYKGKLGPVGINEWWKIKKHKSLPKQDKEKRNNKLLEILKEFHNGNMSRYDAQLLIIDLMKKT